MAVPASFDESNAVLEAPANVDCQALSVYRTEIQDGIPVIFSCWKLTAAELGEINRTGRVWLGILGVTMPPALVLGTKPFEVQG